jgi:hypothetical protein
VTKRFLATTSAADTAKISKPKTAKLENSGTTVVTLSAVAVCSMNSAVSPTVGLSGEF